MAGVFDFSMSPPDEVEVGEPVDVFMKAECTEYDTCGDPLMDIYIDRGDREYNDNYVIASVYVDELTRGQEAIARPGEEYSEVSPPPETVQMSGEYYEITNDGLVFTEPGTYDIDGVGNAWRSYTSQPTEEMSTEVTVVDDTPDFNPDRVDAGCGYVPDKASQGETVNIPVSVQNDNVLPASVDVSLTVGGVTEASETLEIPAESSDGIDVEVTFDSPGDYEIGVDVEATEA